MNLKTIKIISIIGTFILCFLTHFLYELFPNALFSIFFPVNESIWEHMKMLFTTFILFNIIEYFLIMKSNIKVNNYLLATFVGAILSVIIYLIIYLPLYYKFGENMILNIVVLIIAIAISKCISFSILNKKEIKYQNIISSILIIICFIVFGYLTYNPIKTHLFLDTNEEKYGINDYNL